MYGLIDESFDKAGQPGDEWKYLICISNPANCLSEENVLSENGSTTLQIKFRGAFFLGEFLIN